MFNEAHLMQDEQLRDAVDKGAEAKLLPVPESSPAPLGKLAPNSYIINGRGEVLLRNEVHLSSTLYVSPRIHYMHAWDIFQFPFVVGPNQYNSTLDSLLAQPSGVKWDVREGAVTFPAVTEYYEDLRLIPLNPNPAGSNKAVIWQGAYLQTSLKQISKTFQTPNLEDVVSITLSTQNDPEPGYGTANFTVLYRDGRVDTFAGYGILHAGLRHNCVPLTSKVIEGENGNLYYALVPVEYEPLHVTRASDVDSPLSDYRPPELRVFRLRDIDEAEQRLQDTYPWFSKDLFEDEDLVALLTYPFGNIAENFFLDFPDFDYFFSRDLVAGIYGDSKSVKYFPNHFESPEAWYLVARQYCELVCLVNEIEFESPRAIVDHMVPHLNELLKLFLEGVQIRAAALSYARQAFIKQHMPAYASAVPFPRLLFVRDFGRTSTIGTFYPRNNIKVAAASIARDSKKEQRVSTLKELSSLVGYVVAHELGHLKAYSDCDDIEYHSTEYEEAFIEFWSCVFPTYLMYLDEDNPRFINEYGDFDTELLRQEMLRSRGIPDVLYHWSLRTDPKTQHLVIDRDKTSGAFAILGMYLHLLQFVNSEPGAAIGTTKAHALTSSDIHIALIHSCITRELYLPPGYGEDSDCGLGDYHDLAFGQGTAKTLLAGCTNSLYEEYGSNPRRFKRSDSS